MICYGSTIIHWIVLRGHQVRNSPHEDYENTLYLLFFIWCTLCHLIWYLGALPVMVYYI
jgi:hypothetical protein